MRKNVSDYLQQIMACLFCLTVFSCRSGMLYELPDSKEISIQLREEPETFTDLFCDVELTPLEDIREGMLSDVTRLKKKGQYYCILDDGAAPKVCLFYLDGRFARNIGELGHSRNEFISLTDVAFGKNSIVVLDCNHIAKVYDYDNNFLFAKDLGEDMYFKTIEALPNGYVCTSPHLGNSNSQRSLLYFFDENLNFRSEQIISLPKAINNMPFVRHGFHSSDSCYYYFDFFRTTLFRGDLHTQSLLDSYTFQIPRLPTAPDFMEGSFFKRLDNFDCFTQEYIFERKLYAHISYNDIMSSLIVNLDNGEGDVRHYPDWYPKVFDDDGTSLYSIIPADRLITFLENKNHISESTRMILLDCVQSNNKELKPTSNFVILKMKPQR